MSRNRLFVEKLGERRQTLEFALCPTKARNRAICNQSIRCFIALFNFEIRFQSRSASFRKGSAQRLLKPNENYARFNCRRRKVDPHVDDGRDPGCWSPGGDC
jgi:hypothetical protein